MIFVTDKPTNQHRATPEQWEYQERWASDDDDASCILELRARVEALERQAPMTELRAASAEVRPTVKDSLTDAGSLVERVAYAMGPQSQSAMDAGELPHGAARAAIREVAAWLREGGDYSADAWADMMEREVFRG